MNHLRTLVAALAAAAIAGCGAAGHEVDRDAWRADVEPYMDVVNETAFARLQDLWVDDFCGQSEDGFAFFIALGLDDGVEPGLLRVNVKHACPNRLDELDETLTFLGR